MAQSIAFFIIGIIGGIVGGMGMGGGTLLIPLLNVFSNLDQRIIQAINLTVFIPMSIIVLIIHVKHKLVKGKYFLYIALPAVAVSVPSSILASKLSGKLLARFFGIFLIVIGVLQIVNIIKKKVKKRKNAKSSQNFYK